MGGPTVQPALQSVEKNADAESQFPYSSGDKRKVASSPGYDTISYYPASGGAVRQRYFRTTAEGNFQESRWVDGKATWVDASKPDTTSRDTGVKRYFYSDGYLYDESGNRLGRFGINSSASKTELEGKQFLHTFGTLQTSSGKFIDYHGTTLSFGSETALIQMGPPPGMVAAYKKSTAHVLVDAKLNINGYLTDGFRQINNDKAYERIWVSKDEAKKYETGTYTEDRLRELWKKPTDGWTRDGNYLYDPEKTTRFRLIGGEEFQAERKVHYTLNWRDTSSLCTARINWVQDDHIVRLTSAGDGPHDGPIPRRLDPVALPLAPKNSTQWQIPGPAQETKKIDAPPIKVTQQLPAPATLPLPRVVEPPPEEKPVVATVEKKVLPPQEPVVTKEEEVKLPKTEVAKKPPPPPPVVDLLPPPVDQTLAEVTELERNRAGAVAKVFEAKEQLLELVMDIDATFPGAPPPPQARRVAPAGLPPGKVDVLPFADPGTPDGAVVRNEPDAPNPGGRKAGPGALPALDPPRIDPIMTGLSGFDLGERYERMIAEPLREISQGFLTARTREKDAGRKPSPELNNAEITAMIDSSNTLFGGVGFVKAKPAEENIADPNHYLRMRAIITGQGKEKLEEGPKAAAGVLTKLDDNYQKMTEKLRGPENEAARERFLHVLRTMGKDMPAPQAARWETLILMIQEDLTGVKQFFPPGARPKAPKIQRALNLALNGERENHLGELTLPS